VTGSRISSSAGGPAGGSSGRITQYFSFAYLVFGALLRLVCRRGFEFEREVELLALRHELAGIRRMTTLRSSAP
jgi:hypothetical protein